MKKNRSLKMAPRHPAAAVPSTSRNPAVMTPETEVRFLSSSHIQKLGEIMNVNDEWKVFMSLIPRKFGESEPKFTNDDIMTLNRVLMSSSNSWTGMGLLIHEWGDMSMGPGSRRATIGDVLDLCIQAECYRAADYINYTILGKEHVYPPPSNLTSKIFVDIAGLLNAPSTSSSSVTIENVVPGIPPEVLRANDNYFDRIISVSEDPSSNALTSRNNDDEIDSESDTHSAFLSPDSPFPPIHGLKIHGIPINYIRRITQNFGELDPSFKIGSGGYSDVFKGVTGSKKVIAIKRLKNTERRVYQFNNELETIPTLNHPNIIKVLAYSNDDPNHLCLIYPFYKNGSLEDRLHRDPPLTWEVKLSIAKGIIRGIVFLHDEIFTKELIHRDIKTANVLLDDNLIPKIIDFGFLYSKPRHNAEGGAQGAGPGAATDETMVGRGTSAYMAPEVTYYVVHSKLDVFSYGVILLELFSGLRVMDDERDGKDLVTYVLEFEGTWLDLVDKKSGVWNLSRLKRWHDLAMLCIEKNYEIRPRSAEVKRLLNQV